MLMQDSFKAFKKLICLLSFKASVYIFGRLLLKNNVLHTFMRFLSFFIFNSALISPGIWLWKDPALHHHWLEPQCFQKPADKYTLIHQYGPSALRSIRKAMAWFWPLEHLSHQADYCIMCIHTHMQTYCEKNPLAYLCRLANIYTDVTEQIRLVVPEWMKKAF